MARCEKCDGENEEDCNDGFSGCFNPPVDWRTRALLMESERDVARGELAKVARLYTECEIALREALPYWAYAPHFRDAVSVAATLLADRDELIRSHNQFVADVLKVAELMRAGFGVTSHDLVQIVNRAGRG